MKYQNIREKYRGLEKEVLAALRAEIKASKITSKHVSYCTAIKVNVFDYTELAIINDDLTFMDSQGLHYSLWVECSIEDLVDILTAIE